MRKYKCHTRFSSKWGGLRSEVQENCYEPSMPRPKFVARPCIHTTATLHTHYCYLAYSYCGQIETPHRPRADSGFSSTDSRHLLDRESG